MQVTWLSLEWPRAGVHSGGVGRYVSRMAQEMAKIVDLTIVTFDGAFEYPGMKFVTLPAPTNRIGRYYISAWQARDAVRKTNPEIIHAHGDDFLLSGNVPIVRTFYGLSLSEAKSSTGLRRANHFLLAALEQWSARRAAMRLGIAMETVDHFKCESLFPPFFATKPVGERQPSSFPTIVFIGSFQGRKQGWLAQRAVARLRDNEKWRDARLIVIGPADDAANWAPWVDHRSGVSDKIVSEILSQAWLLASPSSYEGFGIPIVESLLHEVGVVALKNPGSSFIYNQSPNSNCLTLTSEVNFCEILQSRIEAGPYLTDDDLDGARRIVSRIIHEGSPARLAELYQKVISHERTA